MEKLSITIGVALLLVSILFTFLCRQKMLDDCEISHAAVFQFCILPLIVGLLMVLTAKIIPLILIPILFVLAWPFSDFLLFVFPLICGWELGTVVIEKHFDTSKGLYYGSGLLGVLAMFFICSIIVAIITIPPPPK